MEKGQDYQELHKPVLLSEVLEGLRVKELAHLKKANFIDATLGLGGHTVEIVKNGGNALGIEADNETLEIARERLKLACPPTFRTNERGFYNLVLGNFRDIDKIAKVNGFNSVDGVLFDLGISSYQLGEKRGFSFQDKSAPLDMRIDPRVAAVKASDLLMLLDAKKLSQVFETTLPRGTSKIIASNIVRKRKEKELKTVGDFLETISGVFRSRDKIHHATLPFLALRIAVNSEIENLREALPKAFELLKPGARLVVISFHSGEDFVVKNFFRREESDGRARILTKKPMVPGEHEVLENPRARSAKMRIIEKI